MLAKEAVQMINERFNIKLLEDEAGFIVFHFVYVQLKLEALGEAEYQERQLLSE